MEEMVKEIAAGSLKKTESFGKTFHTVANSRSISVVNLSGWSS